MTPRRFPYPHVPVPLLRGAVQHHDELPAEPVVVFDRQTSAEAAAPGEQPLLLYVRVAGKCRSQERPRPFAKGKEGTEGMTAFARHDGTRAKPLLAAARLGVGSRHHAAGFQRHQAGCRRPLFAKDPRVGVAGHAVRNRFRARIAVHRNIRYGPEVRLPERHVQIHAQPHARETPAPVSPTPVDFDRVAARGQNVLRPPGPVPVRVAPRGDPSRGRLPEFRDGHLDGLAVDPHREISIGERRTDSFSPDLHCRHVFAGSLPHTVPLATHHMGAHAFRCLCIRPGATRRSLFIPKSTTYEVRNPARR